MMVNTCQKILIQVDDTLFCMKKGGFKLLVTVFILLQLLLLPVSAFDTAEMAREGLTIDRVMVQVGPGETFKVMPAGARVQQVRSDHGVVRDGP